MDRQWVRIQSWHVVRFVYATRANAYATMCGRLVPSDAEVSDALPSGKSCETCLRLYARLADRAPDHATDPVPEEG